MLKYYGFNYEILLLRPIILMVYYVITKLCIISKLFMVGKLRIWLNIPLPICLKPFVVLSQCIICMDAIIGHQNVGYAGRWKRSHWVPTQKLRIQSLTT